MSTLKEISYNILNLFDRKLEDRDTYITIDQIAYNVKYYRSILLRRDVQRGTRLTPFEQEINSDFTFKQASNFGRNALVSDEDIPQPVRLKNRGAGGITQVEDRESDFVYPVDHIHRNRFQQYNKYSPNKTVGAYSDNKIYLFGGLPDTLSSGDSRNFDIRGIFEDPEEVMKLNNPTANTKELDFPIGSDMIQRITKGLINGELSIMSQTGQRVNNE